MRPAANIVYAVTTILPEAYSVNKTVVTTTACDDDDPCCCEFV